MSRIAIVAHAVYPGDPRLRRQADALIGAGHEVDLFCLRARGEAAEEQVGQVRVLRLPVNRGRTGFVGHLAEYVAFVGLAAARLARNHRRRHYDLVQVATLPDFLVLAAAPLKLVGVPMLLDLHEDMPEFFRDRFSRPILRPLLPAVSGAARASAAIADRVITVHEPLRELSIARGVPADKIAVVMNSADPRVFNPVGHPRRPFMEDGELRLIHHSSLQRIYGAAVLVEAVAIVGDALRIRLDIYGDGPYRAELAAIVDRLEVSDRVRLNGPVPIDDLASLIAGADIGVVPTLPEPYLAYSLSTKLLEYAAMGTPIIASDLPTFRAHFTDSAIRFVTPGRADDLADAIRELAADPARAADLGAEALRQSAAYAWPVQAERYVAIAEELIAR